MIVRGVLRAKRKPLVESTQSILNFLHNCYRQDSPEISKLQCGGPEIATYRSDFLNFLDCSVDSKGSSCCCFDVPSLVAVHLSCIRNSLARTLCSALFYPWLGHRAADCCTSRLASSFPYLTGRHPSKHHRPWPSVYQSLSSSPQLFVSWPIFKSSDSLALYSHHVHVFSVCSCKQYH